MTSLLLIVIVGLFSQLVVVDSQLTKKEQRKVVKFHNKFRAQVATGQVYDKVKNLLPPAGDMLKMKWDSELAKEAQVWADACKISHDLDRPDGTGENLSWGSQKNLKKFVQMWFDEIIESAYKGDFPGTFAWPGMYPIGHFTQIGTMKTTWCGHNDGTHIHRSRYALYKELFQAVWAKTHKVGCGLAECSADEAAFFFVCRYSPAGNIIGASVYEASDSACASCPDQCDGNLCKKVKAEKVATGEKCGSELGTDCPEWFCLTDTPTGKCSQDTSGGKVEFTW